MPHYLTNSTAYLIIIFYMFLLSQDNSFGTVKKSSKSSVIVKILKIYNHLKGRTQKLSIQYIVNEKCREPQAEPTSVQQISMYSRI